MSKSKFPKKSLISTAIGAGVIISLAGLPLTSLNANPFSQEQLESGYKVAASETEEANKAKPGERKGHYKKHKSKKAKAWKKEKAKEGYPGKRKGLHKKGKDGKCGAGKCGADAKSKAKGGKCGAGKCGANK